VLRKPAKPHPGGKLVGSYRSKLDLMETEAGIKLIKDVFQRCLAEALNLTRVSAPKYLEYGNGLQDDLAGTQQPVQFHVHHTEHPVEMVQSLAKWKRFALQRYGFAPGTGLYTDMDAIRKDEEVDDTHSNYVDQWDWEKVIRPEQRTLAFLEDTVRRIYRAILDAEEAVAEAFPCLGRRLPGEIRFIHSQELEDRYPDLTPREREEEAARELEAYFLIGIGGKLKSGKVHDLRAADYDDWITKNESGTTGLNGDIIVLDHARGKSLELSSMGIRVNAESLLRQAEEMNQKEKLDMPFHKAVLNQEIPLSIGGGIGQSRLCMLLLQKIHIGEVQVSVWPEDMVRECSASGIRLL
jgi:aspartate--ammonia ligase